MAKLDRLGWAAGLAINAYGVRVGIRVNRADALERVLPRLPPAWKPAASPLVDRLYSLICGGGGSGLTVRRFSLLYGDAARLVRTMDPDQAFGRLESDLKLFVAQASGRRVFVHAGVVGWRRRAIVIPGRTLSGKSTLVAALVRAGATYYSDEFAMLDRRGRVHPFAIPLSLREHGPLAPATKHPVEALGGRAGVGALPVGLVIVTRFRPEARWRPRPLSAGEGVLALLAHTLPARARPVQVLMTLRQAVSGAAVLKGPRGEAQEATASILESVPAAQGEGRGLGRRPRPAAAMR